MIGASFCAPHHSVRLIASQGIYQARHFGMFPNPITGIPGVIGTRRKNGKFACTKFAGVKDALVPAHFRVEPLARL